MQLKKGYGTNHFFSSNYSEYYFAVVITFRYSIFWLYKSHIEDVLFTLQDPRVIRVKFLLSMKLSGLTNFLSRSYSMCQ